MHSVIYVPGLGDDKYKGQRWAVDKWRRFGIEPYFYVTHWRTGTFSEKLSGLLQLIDELSQRGSVSLVGVSAGASLALLAFAARPNRVAAVATICGKVNYPDRVNPNYYTENPAFKESMATVQSALPKIDKSRILVVRPWSDGIVPIADTLIPGAQQKILPTVGHGFSIAFAIIFARGIVGFLKAKAH